MTTVPQRRLPQLSNAGLKATANVIACNEYNEPVEGAIAVERALTIYLDKQEIVTLMTLGTHPEALTIGYLRNQRFIQDLSQIRDVSVDWRTESVQVSTWDGVEGWDEKLKKRTVTTGCGQGTVFSCTLDALYTINLPEVSLRQSMIYGLLENIRQHNEIYKRAGAVHGCGLCRNTDILIFVEDVGRHNAADAIAGSMWLEYLTGADKIFYTTGRLTSEIVMKTAQMGIPVLLSRSGVTNMGLELAQELGVIMVARAKGRHFLVYNGADHIIYDAQPEQRHHRIGK